MATYVGELPARHAGHAKDRSWLDTVQTRQGWWEIERHGTKREAARVIKRHRDWVQRHGYPVKLAIRAEGSEHIIYAKWTEWT